MSLNYVYDERPLDVAVASRNLAAKNTRYGGSYAIHVHEGHYLKVEGFGILTEIDVKATLKKKLDVDFRRYIILGACNPTLAYQALQNEPEIGLLLPCNVIVYEDEGGSAISIVDPIVMLGVVENPELQQVADEAQERLERVIEALTG